MIILDLLSDSSKFKKTKNPIDFFTFTENAADIIRNNKKLNEAFENDLEKFLAELENNAYPYPQVAAILKVKLNLFNFFLIIYFSRTA